MLALLETSIPGLPPPRKGKVREVYDLGDCLLIVATDRISAFDVIMANGIPDKGRVLNQMSAFWFEKLTKSDPSHRSDMSGKVCTGHLITIDDDEIATKIGHHDGLKGRSMLARKAKPLTIECVARGYLSGSLWKEYRDQGGHIHGLDLPAGLRESDRLPEPIFSPATKAEEGHDENISFETAANMAGRDNAVLARTWTLALYRRAAEYALSKGLILADTKFEFGETDDGLILIDEALTPDSSRYWDASQYEPGGPQPSYDKQFVRDYLESIGWDKRPPGPTLPDEVVQNTRAKYLEAYERITDTRIAAFEQ
ncbi:MAG: phosphoribosylaminoimidazolesuccinocarboxamide synthase [Fimbriimonadaceae bacterium]